MTHEGDFGASDGGGSAATPSRRAAGPSAEESHRHRLMALREGDADALERLTEALGSTSWRVRRTALEVMRERFAEHGGLVPALIAGMGSDDNAGLRNACAEALVELGERAVGAVAALMGSPDGDLRKFGIEVLGAIGTDSARDRLMAALVQPDVNARVAVIDALGRIGGPRVVEALRAQLRHEELDLLVAAHLLDALSRCKAVLTRAELSPWMTQKSLGRFVYPLLALSADSAALDALVDGIGAGPTGSRNEAIRGLGQIVSTLDVGGEQVEATRQLLARSPVAMRALEGALQGEDSAVLEAALRVLAVVWPAERAPELLTAAYSRPVMRTAVDLVTRMGSDAIGPLLHAMDKASPGVRLLFLEIIEAIGDPRAAAKLIDLVTTTDAVAADAATRALGRIGGPEAIEPLMDRARSEDKEVAREAAVALANVGARWPDEVAAAVRHGVEESDVRPEWLFIVGALAREEDLHLLLAASRHQDGEVRVAAVDAWRGFAGQISTDTVLHALKDAYAPVRAAAARVLATVQCERAVDGLITALDDRDPHVAAEVARALGTVDDSRVEGALIRAANSAIGMVALAALQSVCRRAPANISDVLQKALAHTDAEVVREAVALSAALVDESAADMLVGALQHEAWVVRLAAAEAMLARGMRPPMTVLEAVWGDEPEESVRRVLQRLRGGGQATL